MISIIVPIYNVEDYLKPCIESILNSTYQEFELILVDDGSTDRSGAICDHFAEQDKRIRVIHKANGGVSSARNKGLEMASGEYVMFIDGDDIIHCRMVEILYQAINTDTYDIALAYIAKVRDVSIEDLIKKTNKELRRLETHEIDQTDYITQVFAINDQYISVCNKLFKRNLIQNLYFNRFKIAEDLEWQTLVCLRMKKAVLVEAHMYYYIQRDGSAMHNGVDGLIKSLDVYVLCLEHIPKDNKKYRATVLKGIFTYMLQIRRICVNANDKKEVERVCSKIYEENIDEFLHSDINWFSKMRSIIGYKYPGPYNFIIKIFEFLPYKRVLAFLHKYT